MIEDETAIRRFLRAGLGPSVAELFEATSGDEGLQLVAQKNPDVVLLDLGLPDMDGLEVLRRIREWNQVPVIILSARGQEKDKIMALDAGADDYLTKPFAIGELLARVRVTLRHSKRLESGTPIFDSEGLRIDFGARYVTLDGAEIRLTQIEFKLLALLAQHAGKVLTQRHIMREVWGAAYEDSSHTLRVHMGNLRQKMESGVNPKRLIRTETGIGYRLLA